MNKLKFKVGDTIIVRRAESPSYNEMIAKIVEIDTETDSTPICVLDSDSMKGRKIRLYDYKLDLYKEENEI